MNNMRILDKIMLYSISVIIFVSSILIIKMICSKIGKIKEEFTVAEEEEEEADEETIYDTEEEETQGSIMVSPLIKVGRRRDTSCRIRNYLTTCCYRFVDGKPKFPKQVDDRTISSPHVKY